MQLRIKSNTLQQVLRYLAIAGVISFVDVGLLLGLANVLGVHYLVSSVLAFILANFLNYLLNVVWVFRSSGASITNYLAFLSISLAGLLLTQIVLFFGVSVFESGLLPSKLSAMVLVLSWNFSMRRRLFRAR